MSLRRFPLLVAAFIAAPAAAWTPPPEHPEMTEVVYFDWDSARLTPEGVRSLDILLSWYVERRGEIRVAGHSDTTGPDDDPLLASQSMADAVRDYLLARGADPQRMIVTAFGATRPDVPAAPGVRERLNRRVEVMLCFDPCSLPIARGAPVVQESVGGAE